MKNGGDRSRLFLRNIVPRCLQALDETPSFAYTPSVLCSCFLIAFGPQLAGLRADVRMVFNRLESLNTKVDFLTQKMTTDREEVSQEPHALHCSFNLCSLSFLLSRCLFHLHSS